MAQLDEFDGLLDEMSELQEDPDQDELKDQELREPVPISKLQERAQQRLEFLEQDLDLVREFADDPDHPEKDADWKERKIEEIQDKREHLVQLLEELEDQDRDALIEGHPHYPPYLDPQERHYHHQRQRGGRA